MSGAPSIKILLIDSDPAFRKALNTYFSKYPNFETIEAEDSLEGFRCASETKPDLIISDHRPPLLDGLGLCRKIKSTPELSLTIFLILTAEKDVTLKTKAFENGADDYIEKSTPPVILTSKINVFLRIKQLQKELKTEKDKFAETNIVLERNFKELTAILLKIIDLRVPGAADRAEIAKHIAQRICEKIDMSGDIKEKIVFGAQLHEIGRIGLPDTIADKSLGTISLSEKAMFKQYPIIGSRIVSAVSGFQNAVDTICHQFENYDGTGTPDRLMAEEIPLGARILRAIVLQEELSKAGQPKEEIIREIRQSANKILDPFIATSLAEFIIENDKDFSTNKYKIRIEELEAGMVIAEDVYAISGVKLLPKGTKLLEHMLQVLMERNNRDPIIGGVYIVKSR